MVDYDELMADRDDSFIATMKKAPNARRNEFLAALKYADIHEGHVVADIPAVGGAIRQFINCEIEFISEESVENFLPTGRDGMAGERELPQDFQTMPFDDESIDRFISIAGLHHIEDLIPFFQDAYRCVKPAGKVIVADVKVDTSVAYYLNHYVDKYSPAGHKGIFLTSAVCDQLAECGFVNAQMRDEVYPWLFDSVSQMVDFMRGLFTLEKATDAEILAALEDSLGFDETEQGVELHWQLSVFTADKVA